MSIISLRSISDRRVVHCHICAFSISCAHERRHAIGRGAGARCARGFALYFLFRGRGRRAKRRFLPRVAYPLPSDVTSVSCAPYGLTLMVRLYNIYGYAHPGQVPARPSLSTGRLIITAFGDYTHTHLRTDLCGGAAAPAARRSAYLARAWPDGVVAALMGSPS